MIIFFVSVNELLLEQLTVHFVYFKEFTLSGSVMQPVPPPPFLFTYEKVRYHIAWLKKRFFFDNLYARMITSILVFLITETGLLQLVFRFFTSLQGNRGQFSSEFIASPPHVPCASTVPSKDLAFVTLIGPAYGRILGFILCSLQNMR